MVNFILSILYTLYTIVLYTLYTIILNANVLNANVLNANVLNANVLNTNTILTKKELHNLKNVKKYCILFKTAELKNKILTQFIDEHINQIYTLTINQAKMGKINLIYKACNTIYFTYYSHMSPLIYRNDMHYFSNEIFNLSVYQISNQLKYIFPDTDIQIEQKNECIYFELNW